MPNTVWLSRSCMKLPTSLDPYWDDARTSVISVIEKTVLVTPNIAPAIVERILRAESTPPVKKNAKTPEG